MDSAALNYDPFATHYEQCYLPYEGCLDPNALNYNCTLRAFPPVKCITADTYSSTPGTVHSDGLCIYSVPSPSPPPPPVVLPPQGPATQIATQLVVKSVMVLEDTVSDYT